MRYWMLFLFMLVISAFSVAKVIPVATVDWCPQMCPGEDKPGYIIDILKTVYLDSEYELTFEAVPWSRGLKRTQKGDNVAMLAPSKRESPELLFPTFSLGTQRMCLYTRADSDWTYSDPQSLKGLQIGMAYDTQIEGISEYAQQHPDNFQMQPYLSRYFMQNVGKLKKSRIDAFIYTYQSTIWEARANGVEDDIRLAGCAPAEEIYIAFTAQPHKRELVNKLIQHFDQEYPNLVASGKVTAIMARYGLVTSDNNGPVAH